MAKILKFISILSDHGRFAARFKVTFVDEQDTLFLRKSLEALISLPNPIREVYFSRNEFSGVTEDSRGGLYDLVCEDESGNTFIVEIQLGYYQHYMERAMFYAFQKLNTMVEKGNTSLTTSLLFTVLDFWRTIFSHQRSITTTEP